MTPYRTTTLATFAILALSALLFHIACHYTACHALEGPWSTREGQCIEFLADGQALWITRFGSQFDTVRMAFRYDCTKQPAELDLFGFSSGPLTDKTLFGILEWSSDTAFRFNAEPGTDPAVRPQTFESDQTMKFLKGRGNGG